MYMKFLECLCIKDGIKKSNASLLYLLANRDEAIIGEKDGFFILIDDKKEFADKLGVKTAIIDKRIHELCKGELLHRIVGKKAKYRLSENVISEAEWNKRKKVEISFK